MEWLSSYEAALLRFVLNPEIYVFAGGVLILEHFFPVKKYAHMLRLGIKQDYVYGVMNWWVFWPIVLAYTALWKGIYDRWLPFTEWGLSSGWHPVALVLTGFLIDDFMEYWLHYLRHKIPMLWHFHVIHHSQTDMNPLTEDRIHIVEHLLKEPIKYLPMALIGASLPQWFLFKLFLHSWGYVVHSNLRLELGWLKFVIITPQVHRIHHSVEKKHWDKNFGVKLTIWDWMFGTLYIEPKSYPETGTPHETAFPIEQRMGMADLVGNFVRQFCYPFKMLIKQGLNRHD